MRFPKVALRVVAEAAVAVALLFALACHKERYASMAERAEPQRYFRASRGILEGRGYGGGLGGGDRLDQQVSANLLATDGDAPPLAAPASRKIVRNGSLQLVVGDVGQASGKIRDIVNGLGGYVEKSSQTNVGGRSATLTARVPAASLDQAMSQIEKVAVSVDQESVEARDITREYIDLDARFAECAGGGGAVPRDSQASRDDQGHARRCGETEQCPRAN